MIPSKMKQHGKLLSGGDLAVMDKYFPQDEEYHNCVYKGKSRNCVLQARFPCPFEAECKPIKPINDKNPKT